ncbi:MAG: hypothetical protein GY889_05510, partial [Proteobacteria bacterium]|nr:hypothetical protein [Pseudomonadota bacterium]
KNDKGDNPKRPDMTGTFDFEGTEYRIAAWKRVSGKTGKPFLSITAELPNADYAKASNSAVVEQADDDLPF